jgi:hypothetical protein
VCHLRLCKGAVAEELLKDGAVHGCHLTETPGACQQIQNRM